MNQLRAPTELREDLPTAALAPDVFLAALFGRLVVRGDRGEFDPTVRNDGPLGRTRAREGLHDRRPDHDGDGVGVTAFVV